MKVQAAPDYGSVDGLKKLYFLRREDDDVAHFLLVTLWDSMESVKKFAGDRPEAGITVPYTAANYAAISSVNYKLIASRDPK